MENTTIIQKLVETAESYGIENTNAIRETFEHDTPRCGLCGSPLITIDMDTCAGIYMGCPHQDIEMQHTEYHIQTV